jgi:flagellar basal-body rod protein FlgC
MQTHLFAGADISASGMSAERQRMEVVAHNIANANSTQTVDGGPYRRQQLVFATALNSTGGVDGLQGVEVVGLQKDDTPGPKIHNPTHPNADVNGMVEMPNVKLPNEMVDLITASRSYEANLKALTTFKEMIEQTLQLLRGTR